MNSKMLHQTTKVAMAARDLEIGTLIKADDLKVGDVVGDPPKDVLVQPSAAVGRGVLSMIYAGEPITEKRLAALGSGGGLAATIPAGMRACAIKVDQVVGVAGFVVPGMRVDVLVSGNENPNEANTIGMKTRTLLENLEVLSAGTNFQKDNEGKPVQVTVVNLLVTPPQAELLSLASNQTHIQLVLRNPLDTQVAKPPGTEMAALFGEPAKPKPPVVHRAVSAPAPAAPKPPAPPPQWVVRVTNGSKETKEAFAATSN